jgi:hypothetical protein
LIKSKPDRFFTLIRPYVPRLWFGRNIINIAPAQDGKFNVLFKRRGLDPQFKIIWPVHNANSAREPHAKTCDHLREAKQSWARQCAAKITACPNMKLLQRVVRTQQDTRRRNLACDSPS